MVNDPKWRTISRKSGQKIGDVISVYLHMLTLASNATERGRTQGWCDEDVGTALDIDESQVKAIRDAMQCRVLNGDYLTGWEKRQPSKEDGSAERAKAWREAKKAEKQHSNNEEQTTPNETERDRTTEEIREEEIREELKPTTPSGVVVPSDAGDLPEGISKTEKHDCPHQQIIALYHEVLPQCPQVRDWTPARAVQLRARWNEEPRRQNMAYWRQFFEYVGSCDFLVGKCHGKDRKPFFADLEWIVKSSNFTKIREGKYANQ
jgi:hypothetical protein